MKKLFRTAAACICALLAAIVFTQAEMRTWTSVTGNAIEAEFVSQSVDQVILRKADGEELEIRVNQLSREDQVYVGSLRAPAARNPRNEPASAVPPAIREAFGEQLVDARKNRISPADLEGKKIGLYFSAQWCPPCRAFTPVLVDAYNEMQKQGKQFEIIFVSRDRAEADMYKYMRDYKMPWPAFPFTEIRDTLRDKHEVRGIPALVIVDDKGNTITRNGRADIQAHGAAAFDRW